MAVPGGGVIRTKATTEPGLTSTSTALNSTPFSTCWEMVVCRAARNAWIRKASEFRAAKSMFAIVMLNSTLASAATPSPAGALSSCRRRVPLVAFDGESVVVATAAAAARTASFCAET